MGGAQTKEPVMATISAAKGKDERLQAMPTPSVLTLVHASPRVPSDGVCGYTREGIPAYSNGHDKNWTATKHHLDGVFMGYRWQCVEFARRWLWGKHGLLLPQVNCAFSYQGLKHVRQPTPAVLHPTAATQGKGEAEGAITDNNAPLSAVDYAHVEWRKYPCRYVAQGASTPPAGDSLIIYPMSMGSPFGHIGVITEVDLDAGLVYVADQNRFFQHWGDCHYSAVFRLDCVGGRYYIRDHESECAGWILFDVDGKATASDSA